MKVLWVVNKPLPEVSEALGLKKELSQSWLQDLARVVREADITLCSACVEKVDSLRTTHCCDGNHYVIPMASKFSGASVYEKYWRQIMEAEKPDLIHLHGTEYAHTLPLLNCAGKIPTVLTIQGVMTRIAEHYAGSLRFGQLLKYRTLKENLRLGGMLATRAQYRKQARSEQEIIKRVDCVTGRTLWDYAIMKQINPDLKYYACTYNLRDGFYKADKWDLDQAQRHTVYTAFSSYPLKGLHILLRALAIVKERFPNVLLKVPGVKGDKDGRLIIISGYTKYLSHLISRLKLQDNVRFLGGQSEADVITNMQKAHLCVVSSAIEGASATVREAMHIGTPCICSFRGGMTELLEDRRSGFYYDYPEYPYLAERIMQIFENDQLAKQFSQNSIASAEAMHDRQANGEKWLQVYRDMMKICED